MIVIAGGGLSGLFLAYYLKKAGKDYILFEKESDPGGCLKSLKAGNYLLELGPNTLLCDEFILNLLDELQLKDKVISPLSVNKDRFVFKNNAYQRLPSGPKDLILGNFFSPNAKFNILKELFKKKGVSNTETLEQFFVEHFGKEITDFALNPFISGIYAGDPKEIILDETFPILREYEKEIGSVLKGIIKNVGIRKSTVNFKEGMKTLPITLARGLKIQYNSSIVDLEKVNNIFEISVLQLGNIEKIKAEKIVFTVPAFEMASILNKNYKDFADSLKQIKYPPMSIVHSVYNKNSVKSSIEGFGGLHPKVENKFSAGSIWTSSIFPERTTEGTKMFTTFVGGTQYITNADLGEDEVKRKVNMELKQDFAISKDPIFQNYYYWKTSIPQYNRDMQKAKSFLPMYEKENLFVCSNIFDGISMPDCIKKAEVLAKKLAKLSEN